MAVEYGTDKMSRNVGDYKPTLRNITEERKSYLHRNGSLKSCTCFVNVLQDA
jgi:cytochrome c peroxidase